MTPPISLPADLDWLDYRLPELIRPGAFLRPDPARVAAQGATRAWGLPDLPADAPWARYPARTPHWNVMPWAWGQSPYDGESFWLQLNLEEVPAQVRGPQWPTVGVVWVFIDLSQGWTAEARFDPRPAASIPWQPRLEEKLPAAAQWTVTPTIADCTETTLPELWHSPEWCEVYNDWAQETFGRKTEFQVGGWVWPCQGDFDPRNTDFVCGITGQSFGDSGAVYLHYDAVRGFYARVETH